LIVEWFYFKIVLSSVCFNNLESNSFTNQLLQSVFPCPSGRRALYLLKTAVILRHEASLPTAGRCFIVCRFFVPQNDNVNDLLQFKKMPLQYG